MDDFKKERDEALEEALAIGLTHRKNGRLKEAAAVYSQVLGLDPNNLEALEAMGETPKSSILIQKTSALSITAASI